MKKLFTLVCGLAMALCANAATSITTSFSSWGDGCTVDGNTITFIEAWKGAGAWIGDADYSDSDYLWVTFSETTCNFKLVVQHTGDDPHDVTGTFNSGALVAGVALNENYSDHVMQYYLQATSGGKVVITGAYVGTEEEYKEVLAGNKPKVSELSLANLGSGWGESTYDAATHTVTIGDDWSGKGWWLDKVDYSDFDKLVITFDPATATNGKVVVEYNDGVTSSENSFDAGATSVEVTLDATGKSSVKQIYIQGAAGSTYTLSSAYVCVDDYVPSGISNVAVAESAKTAKAYNLAGMQVDDSYKGIVIQNGKKFVRK